MEQSRNEAVVVCHPASRPSLVGLATIAGLRVVGAGPPWPQVTDPPLVLVLDGGLAEVGAEPWPEIQRKVVISTPAIAAVGLVLGRLAGDHDPFPPARIAAIGTLGIPDMEELGWLKRLAHGARTIDIALEAGLSERQLYRRLRTLYRKLGCGTRAQALAIAGEMRLLAPDETGDQ